MSRKRFICPGFFKNESLSELSFPARLLWIGMWLLSDREGLLENRPKKIRAELFPYDDEISNKDIVYWIEELERLGFILCYHAEGMDLIFHRTWRKHQRPHPKEAPTVLPLPPNATLFPTEGSPSNTEGWRVGFGDFWRKYPKKTHVAEAEKCYRRILKAGATLPVLLKGLDHWTKIWKRERRPDAKIPSAYTWILREDWKDASLAVCNTAEKKKKAIECFACQGKGTGISGQCLKCQGTGMIVICT